MNILLKTAVVLTASVSISASASVLYFSEDNLSTGFSITANTDSGSTTLSGSYNGAGLFAQAGAGNLNDSQYTRFAQVSVSANPFSFTSSISTDDSPNSDDFANDPGYQAITSQHSEVYTQWNAQFVVAGGDSGFIFGTQTLGTATLNNGSVVNDGSDQATWYARLENVTTGETVFDTSSFRGNRVFEERSVTLYNNNEYALYSELYAYNDSFDEDPWFTASFDGTLVSEPASVSEPSILALMALGLFGVFARSRRKNLA